MTRRLRRSARVRDTGRRLILVTGSRVAGPPRDLSATRAVRPQSSRKTARSSYCPAHAPRRSSSPSLRPSRLSARCATVVCPPSAVGRVIVATWKPRRNHRPGGHPRFRTRTACDVEQGRRDGASGGRRPRRPASPRHSASSVLSAHNVVGIGDAETISMRSLHLCRVLGLPWPTPCRCSRPGVDLVSPGDRWSWVSRS